MRKYELTVIFDTNDEMTENGQSFVSEQFASANVNVLKQEDIGIKSFAYEIKKQKKGHYFFFELEADPQSINKISSEFLLQTFILKFLFVSK